MCQSSMDLFEPKYFLLLAFNSAEPPFNRLVDREKPIILGRPFLATGRAMINVQRGELKLRVQDNEVRFSVFNVVWHLVESDACFMIEAVETTVSSQSGLTDPLETSLV